MHSTDQTAALAKKAGAKVISVPFFDYVEPVRNSAFQNTKTDWVFILDADERITTELAEEILQSVRSTKFTHFKVPRKNIFLGQKWLRHGGWWPDYQIRLIKKAAFINWPQAIHSTVQMEGEMDFLKEPFLHYFHPSLENMVDKTAKFECKEATLLYEAGRRVTTLTFFRKYLAELYRRLIKQRGFLDGTLGIVESVYQAYSKTITWILLYEMKKTKPKTT